MEVKPDHFASCFQYGGLEDSQEKEPGETQANTAEEGV